MCIRDRLFIVTGPSNVGIPEGSTAYAYMLVVAAGTPVRSTQTFVPSAARITRAIPVDPVTVVTGVRLIETSLPTGYSITVYVPSAFWTTSVFLVVVTFCAKVAQRRP